MHALRSFAVAGSLALTLVGCADANTPDPNAEPVGCTAEQLSTLTAASGVPVPDDVVTGGTVTFEPPSAIEGLATTCILTFSASGFNASFAVLPGGDATLARVQSNLEADGGTPQVSDGHVSATIGDNTVVAANFALVTEETTGFENVEDLVVVLSSPVSR